MCAASRARHGGGQIEANECIGSAPPPQVMADSGLAESSPSPSFSKIRMSQTSLLKQVSNLGRRQLSTTAASATGRLPWFVDPTPFVRPKGPHLVENGPAPLPEGTPSVVKNLHAALKTSPHLDQSELLVCEPIPTLPGPPLPDAIPKGRRRRGRTYVGEGVAPGVVGGLWNWIILAQVSLPYQWSITV